MLAIAYDAILSCSCTFKIRLIYTSFYPRQVQLKLIPIDPNTFKIGFENRQEHSNPYSYETILLCITVLGKKHILAVFFL